MCGECLLCPLYPLLSHVKGFLFFILAGLKTDFMPWIPGITKCNWEKCTFLISEDIGGLTFISFIAHNWGKKKSICVINWPGVRSRLLDIDALLYILRRYQLKLKSMEQTWSIKDLSLVRITLFLEGPKRGIPSGEDLRPCCQLR